MRLFLAVLFSLALAGVAAEWIAVGYMPQQHPFAVGMARDPQVWIKAGDVMEVEIGGIGVLRNPVVEV